MSFVYDGTLTASALADPNNTHAILLRLVGNDKAVLEIGPATGYMTRVMTQMQNCRVTALEKDAQAAAEAAPYLQSLIVGDLENSRDLENIEGEFDVVLIADVLEHLAFPDPALCVLHDHLRPGGHLIVSIPNVAHWSVRRALLSGRWELQDRGLMDRTHLRWYTRRSAMALLGSTGYHIIQRRCSYVFPAHWRLGWGPRLAAWAQGRSMSPAFDELFGIQHIFVAVGKR